MPNYSILPLRRRDIPLLRVIIFISTFIDRSSSTSVVGLFGGRFGHTAQVLPFLATSSNPTADSAWGNNTLDF